MNRKPIFDAVRKMLGRGFRQSEVSALDAALDAAFADPIGIAHTGQRRINKAGIDLIKAFEGLRLEAYLCPAGIPTIGYGSTGDHVRMGMVITEERAGALLREDLERFERAVAKKCPVATDNQFAAMVSLAFNIGTAGFDKSSVARFHNAGEPSKAADAFLMWNKATVGGRKVILKGLTRRREAERALYLT